MKIIFGAALAGLDITKLRKFSNDTLKPFVTDWLRGPVVDKERKRGAGAIKDYALELSTLIEEVEVESLLTSYTS